MDRKDLELVLPRLDYRAYLVSASMFSIMLSGDCLAASLMSGMVRLLERKAR